MPRHMIVTGMPTPYSPILTWQVCRGHQNNIVDLAWSPDDRLLATASLDNHAVIWDPRIGRRLEQLQHHGFCKGVSWDPLGTYLATQGDDGVRVWRVEGWSQVAHFKSHFTYASQQTFSLRCGWAGELQEKVVGGMAGAS